MNDKKNLLLIGDKEILSDIETLLGKDFTTICRKPYQLMDEDFQGVSFFVVFGNLSSLKRKQLHQISAAVMQQDCTLVLIGAGLELPPDNEDFFRFVGAKRTAANFVKEYPLRVYPHFLTRSIAEEVKFSGWLSQYQLSEALTLKDVSFVTGEDGICLAYEKIYGLKGRVICLMLGGDGLTELEQKILSNLCYLKHTAKGIDKSFEGEITDILEFDKNCIAEPHETIGRWNTLYTTSESAYTHSSVFLPGSPEFVQKRAGIWKNPKKDKIKEKLFLSLSSVEIQNTDYCSQDCYYCYNRRSMDFGYERTQLQEHAHIQLEEELLYMAKRQVFSVRYTGTGEPLNHPRTFESLIRFDAAGLPVILVTNGMNLTQEQAKRLSRTNAYLRFSIDAATSQSYAKIRRCDEQVFLKVKESIASAAAGNALVGATFLVCRENFAEIYDFCVMAKSLGIKILWIRSTDNADPFDEYEMNYINEQLKRANGLIDSGFMIFSAQFTIYRKVSALHYKYDDILCWSAYTKAFIKPNGDVIVCLSRPDFVLGNLNDNCFSQIWGGEKHKAFLEAKEYRQCSQCVESRYNRATDFLVRHIDDTIYKGTRTIQ